MYIRKRLRKPTPEFLAIERVSFEQNGLKNDACGVIWGGTKAGPRAYADVTAGRWQGVEVVEVDDVRFNARERAGDKRRAFVCRLTDGRIAAIYDGVSEDAEPEMMASLDQAKRQLALLVPDPRVPLYQDHELKIVQRALAGISSLSPV